MAETTAAANVTVEQWDDQFFVEYVRGNRFNRYMGTEITNIIRVQEDLTTKPGDGITFGFLARLKGNGVSGDAVLEGNEESLDQYGHKVTVDVQRNGVIVTDKQNRLTPISLRQKARPALMMWAKEQIRDGIIDALGCVSTADGENILYSAATESNKDTWLANNSDRVLFGAAKSNNAANDHSVCLANVDSTNDKLTAAVVSLAKRMAGAKRTGAAPQMSPFRTEGDDQEWWVMFCAPQSFRDLKGDSVITQANREARARGMDNPLFTDGDLIWDGVVIREIPEISVISSVGAGSIDVAPNYLCGQSALGVAYAERPNTTTYTRDANFRKGTAVQMNWGVEKLFMNKRQFGVVTVYTSGVSD